LQQRCLAHFVARPRRFPHQIDLGGFHFFERFDLFFHLAGQCPGDGARGGGERHLDRDAVVVGDVDVIDQPEFVNVHGDFGVINGPEGLDDLAFQKLLLDRRGERVGCV